MKNFIAYLFLLSTAYCIQPGCVELYEHCDYRGRVQTICHSLNSFCNINFSNILSSVKLGDGVEIGLYKDENFRGGKLIVREDMNCLLKKSFNDVASSLKIIKIAKSPVPKYSRQTKPGKGCAILFGECPHMTKKSLKAIQICTNKPDLSKFPFKIRGIKVTHGYKAELFKFKQFKSAFRNVYSAHWWCGKSQNNLPPLSIIIKEKVKLKPRRVGPVVKYKPKLIRPTPPKMGCVTFFEHCNFQGRYFKSCNSMKKISTDFNKKISSVMVGPKTKVTVFSELNWKGKHKYYLKNDNCFVNEKFNDKTKSFIILVKIVRPKRPAKGCARIFSQQNYKGKNIELCASHPNLQILGFHNKVNSIWVGPHTKINIYEQKTYKGNFKPFTKNNPNTSKIIKNTDSAKMFSLKVICKTIAEEETDKSSNDLNPNSNSKPVKKPYVKPQTNPIHKIKGMVMNAINGKIIKNISKFNIVATSITNKKRYTAITYSGYFLFPEIGEDRYEFSISGNSSFIPVKIIKTVTSKNFNSSKSWTFNLSPKMSIKKVRVVLTWSHKPKDLDAVFTIVDQKTKEFERVDWDNMKTKDGLVKLDVDSTEGYGPETITFDNKIIKMKKDINYFVQNISRKPQMAKSNAVVDVYHQNKLIKRYKVPTNQKDKEFWHVFKIQGDKFIVINKFKSRQQTGIPDD